MRFFYKEKFCLIYYRERLDYDRLSEYKNCHDIISQQVRENFGDLYMNK